jgi:hypothetical protein
VLHSCPGIRFAQRIRHRSKHQQPVHPAEGYIRYDYIIPAGYYPQLWDWDGYFIGVHWANQNAADAKYLKGWLLRL